MDNIQKIVLLTTLKAGEVVFQKGAILYPPFHEAIIDQVSTDGYGLQIYREAVIPKDETQDIDVLDMEDILGPSAVVKKDIPVKTRKPRKSKNV